MFRSISHITLLALILLSATGLTISLHYCQDDLYDLALNSSANDCTEERENKMHCHHSSNTGRDDNCEDEEIKIDPTDDFLISSLSFDFGKVHKTDLLPVKEIPENRCTVNEAKILAYNYKKPPNANGVLLSDIQFFLL